MTVHLLKVAAIGSALLLPLTSTAYAKSCKMVSSDGWGITEQLAKWQASDMLLLSTGNLISQSDKFSKPQYKCSFSVLGWTCKATAKVCKK